MKNYPKLLSPEEVAKILRISPAAVRHLLRTEQLRGVRIGGSWRVSEETIAELLKEASHERGEE